MAIRGEKLRSAREQKGLSQQQLAEAAGTIQATIDRLERGLTASSKHLPKIAAALEIDIAELDTSFALGSVSFPQKTSEIHDTRRIPIYAATDCGDGTMILSQQPVDSIPTPDPLKSISDGYGVMVADNSMFPAFVPGDIALVNPHLPPLPNSDILLFNGDRAILRNHSKSTVSEWFVRQWNPPEGLNADQTMPRSEWAKVHKVIGKFSRL